MKTLGRLMLCLGLLVPGLAFGQAATIVGLVTDENGEPLPGANVGIPRLNVGSATDVEGVYEFIVDENRVLGQTVVLVAQFVGYATVERRIELTPGILTQDFQLEPDLLNLDDIVVTGVIGSTPQKKLAFSVGKVSADKLEQVPAADPASALAGKIAGVNVASRGGTPGEAASIRLRGSTNISGSQAPLIIVDGVILEGTLADINSQDIQSIEVVKGAAAASLYGSRAANGVVQIFTKRGSDVPEGATRVTIRNEVGRSWLSRQIDLADHHPYLVQDGEFVDLDGNPIPVGGSRILDGAGYLDNDYPGDVQDLQRDVFEPGNTYTNYVSVARNTQGGNYAVSFENLQQDGILFGQKGYGRQNARINLDQNIFQGLDLSASMLYGQSNNDLVDQGPGSPFFTLLFLDPTVDLEAPNEVDGSSYNLFPDPYVTEENPLYGLANEQRERDRTRFLGNVALNWQPRSWFGLEGSLSMDRQNNVFELYQFKGYLEEGATGAVPGPGSLDRSTFNERAYNTSVTASFNRVIGPLTSRLKLSYLYEDSHYESLEATGTEFAVVDIPDLGAISGNKTIDSYIEDIRAENYFAILGLDLYDRYIVDFLVRRDGSSLFGEDERWHTYYRTSGAYRISEDFSIPGINEWRVRASYGTAGLRPDFDAQYETYTLSGGIPTKSTLGNRDLKPAFATEIEVGTNIDVFDRLGLELTYANTTVEDQILLVPLSAAAGGFANQWQNAGTLESNTFEASLDAVIKQARDFTWTANLVFDRTRQEVTELDRPPFYTGPCCVDGDYYQNADIFYVAEGEPFGIAYGNRWAEDVSGLPGGTFTAEQYADATGGEYGLPAGEYTINSDGYVIPAGTEGTADESPVLLQDAEGGTTFRIMNIQPDFNVGFSSSLRIGNFQAYALLGWQQGGEVYNQTRQWTYRESRHGEMDQSGVSEAAKKSVNYFQGFYNANNPSNYFVEDATYLKLRELSFRYSFGATQLQGVAGGYLQRVTLGLIGRNLFTFSGYSGYDPEVAGIAGDATNFKFDGFGYPNFRTLTGVIEFVF